MRPDQQQLLLELSPFHLPSPKRLQGGPQCHILTRKAEGQRLGSLDKAIEQMPLPSRAGLGLLNRNCQGPAFPITDSTVIVSKQSSEPPTKHVSDLGQGFCRLLKTTSKEIQ